LGMAEILRQLGKRVRIVNGQATPPNLAFIDPRREIRALGVDITPADLADCDLIMILDTSAAVQLGPMREVVAQTSAQKLILDHHVNLDDLGAVAFKNTSAEATGRLVFEAAAALGAQVTPSVATPLFAALATDTGWFRFGSTTAATYQLAAALVSAGAS